ncbi:unnamed protein product [Rhodiola kirilowii]
MDSEGRRMETVSLNVQHGEPCLVFPAEKTKEELYYLSNLDQNLALMVRTIYCYKATSFQKNESAAELIRKSLEKVLVPYYPLAGRLTICSDCKLAVKCNEGVLFVEAEANCPLEELGDITAPDALVLNKLVPDVHASTSVLQRPLLMTQQYYASGKLVSLVPTFEYAVSDYRYVYLETATSKKYDVTKFKCGGFVLGLSVNHCMCDGVAAMEFVNSWGEMARGLPLSVPPFLDRTILKPRSPLKTMYNHVEFSEVPLKTTEPCEDVIYASFNFSPDKLAELKKKAVNYDHFNQSCTTFQALSALIWRTRTFALNLHPDQETKLVFAVDVRSRMNPPLPKGYFGNGIVLASSLGKVGELINNPLSYAVKLVQESIDTVTDDFIKSVIDYLEVSRGRPSLSSTLVITTWTKLALHAMDFGWGQPALSWPVGLPEKEVAMLLPDGPDRKGINVYLGLPSSAMKAFQELIKLH